MLAAFFGSPILASLVFVLVSIAVGIVSSAWYPAVFLLVRRCCGDPRLRGLRKLRGDLAAALPEDDADRVEAFYTLWAVTKPKVAAPLEFALFGVYAANFCARVFGVVVLVIAGLLVRAAFITADFADVLAACAPFAALAVLLVFCMRHHTDS